MVDSSESHRRFLEILSAEGRIKRNHALKKIQSEPPRFRNCSDSARGRSDYIVVIRPDNFNNYVMKRFLGDCPKRLVLDWME